MSGVRKKQEDKNIRIFRELLSFENNKYCFDCNQRGPTYVNITIGSFVCTSCGGALRKYSHRVKSISMSNFNQTEMDFLKKRGNNICKKIYYGLCENNIPPDVDIKDGMLDSHLRAKYEQKKWYLEPTQKLEEETVKENQTIFDRVEVVPAKLVKSFTVNSSSNIIIEPPRQPSGKLTSSKVIRSSIDVASMPSLASVPNTQHKSSVDVTSGVIDPSKLSGGSAVRLPMPNNNPKILAKQSNFDLKTNVTETSPFGDNFTFSPPISKSQTMNFSMPTLLPVKHSSSTNHESIVQEQNGKYNRQRTNADKYAALAELDDLFSTVTISRPADTGQASSAPGWATGAHAVNHDPSWSYSSDHDHSSLLNPFSYQPSASSATTGSAASSSRSSNPFNHQPAPPAPPPSSSSAAALASLTLSSNHWPAPQPSSNPFIANSSMPVKSSTNPFL